MQLEISTNVFDTAIITFDHCFTSPYWREQKSFLKFTTQVFNLYIILNKKPNVIIGNTRLHMCIHDYLHCQLHKNEDILY